MPGYRWGNKKNLREVKTLFNLAEIDKAYEEGNIILFKERVQDRRMWIDRVIFRNRKTGKHESAQAPGYHKEYRGDCIDDYSVEEWEVVLFTKCYLRNVDHQYGAYIIPKDVKVGEKLYIETLIEDLYMGDFYDFRYFSEDNEARWDGKDLIHDKQGIPFIG